MKLYSLIKNIKCRILGNLLVDISGLYHKDSEVKKNGLFFCLSGTNVDGENFINNAVINGAVAIVVEREQKLCGVTQIIVKDARRAMSLMASEFYQNPHKRLKIIGVTGTNGKTTITHIFDQVMSSLNKKTAIIGTNGIKYCGKIYDTGMTTPDPIILQKHLSCMLQRGVEYVFMEVSAHALDLHKVEGIIFDAMVFTNLTQDHLDYFLTMENYYRAKEKAFLLNRTKLSIINVDDEYGVRLLRSIKTPVITYSTSKHADIEANDICIKENKQIFKVDNKLFTSNLLGRFNVSNILAVIGYLNHCGINDDKIVELVSAVKVVNGRFNTIIINNRLFVVDYAHTPDGLENVLCLCKNLLSENGKLISVFGCGGNRETQKRSIMGQISSKCADFTVITSDNPRFESRELIAHDIEKGMLNDQYKIILDRVDAIKFAYQISKANDIVLLAGKGSENYIDENGIKTQYSDMDEIKKLRGVND